VKAEHFSPDVRELIALLAKHEVRYLLVGGEAVIYHGYPRLTGDVDFWFEQEPANAQRLFDALTEFWAGSVPGLATAAELLEPGVVVQFGRPPHRVDFLSSADGLQFAEAWPGRVAEVLESDECAASIAVVGLADLIKNKQSAGRHKDLDDVEHLEPLLGKR
jgi:hypothetical protein